MDTVDSIGAYWSFYSFWNSLNVLPMTQSDAPNEGRENKTTVDFLIEFSPTPKAGYEDTWILRSMEAYKRQETESLRDQLSKEREKNKRLEEGILKFVHHWRIFFNSPKVGQPPNLSDLESLIAKASELDKNQKQ